MPFFAFAKKFSILIIVLSFPILMAENQQKAPVQKTGETLADNSKTEDVRMSNIIAAKGRIVIGLHSFSSCCGCN